MPAASKLRVIADTNSWISRFILPNSLTGRRMKRLSLDKRWALVFSQGLKDEISSVIQRPKFRRYLTAADLEIYRAYLMVLPSTPGTSDVALCRDAKDNFLLNLALDSQADYLITGDEDLLALGSIGTTRIVTLAEFVQLDEGTSPVARGPSGSGPRRRWE